MAGYQALYRAWRPEKFADVYGQESVTNTLMHQIVSGHIAHAYLFCGSRGTGKTSTAKVLARAINCLTPRGGEPCGECAACIQLKNESSLDVLEIDAASNNGVDEVRLLRDRIAYPPTVGRYKVYIIDEVHMLSTGAFNALLKTLEEPPAHAVFILATTEPQKLLPTVVSRCQRYDFRRISVKTIIARMKVILDGIGRQCEDEALEEIAVSADGGMRDALSLLDMCLSYTDGVVPAALVREVLGSSGRAFMFEFCDALEQSDPGKALIMIDRAMRDGRDPRTFAREVAAHLRVILMSQMMGDELADICEITNEDAEKFRAQGKRFENARLVRAMDMFINLDGSIRHAAQPRSVLEMCAVSASRISKEKTLEGLTERIQALEKQISEGIRVAPAVQAKPAAAGAKEPAKAPAEKQAQEVYEAPESPDKACFEKAKELYNAKNPSTRAHMNAMKFQKREGDTVYALIEARNKMFHMVLSSRVSQLEPVFSEAYGMPVKLVINLAGDTKPQTGISGKQLADVYDMFGRENITLVDEQ